MSKIVNFLYFKWKFKKHNESHLIKIHSGCGEGLAEEREGDGEGDGGEDGSEVGAGVAEVLLAGVDPVLGAALNMSLVSLPLLSHPTTTLSTDFSAWALPVSQLSL